MLVRILTENKNYPDVLHCIKTTIDGATVYNNANGLWDNKWEHTLVIELNFDKLDEKSQGLIDGLCYQIKRLNKQDKILVQYIDCTSRLI